MRLLQSLVLQRRVLQWLIPPISLWVAIVCSLAFSGSAAADPDHGIVRDQTPRPSTVENLYSFPVHSTAGARAVPAIYKSLVEPHTPVLAVGHSIDPQERLDNQIAIDGFFSPPHSPSRTFPFIRKENCPTPMSLMLHSAFGLAQMRALAREIDSRGYIATTYREITEGLDRGFCPAEGSIVISLDDFPTDWLRFEFVRLIEAFVERNLVLVIAVNVRGPQDPDAWAYLRQLESQGFEVASHTIDHYSLSQLEPDRIYRQVVGSFQVICFNLGRCPDTLVLPFGNLDESGYTLDVAGKYSFVVGIPGGRWFGGEPPFYVGRIGPNGPAIQATLDALAASFGVERSQTYAMRGLEQLKRVRCIGSPGGSSASPHFSCSSVGPSSRSYNPHSQTVRTSE